MSSIQPPTGKAKTFFRIVAYVSFAIMMAVFGYAVISLLTQGVGIIGSNLVNVEFPPPSIFPIYAKPITILYVATLTFMYAELELMRGRAARISHESLRVYKFLSFFSATIAFFELAYNLIFWSGGIAAQAVLGHLNPDAIANPYPDLLHPINVVFASKIAAVFLIAGVYVFYYISKIEDARDSLSPPVTSAQPR
jgi:hypothetical protein